MKFHVKHFMLLVSAFALVGFAVLLSATLQIAETSHSTCSGAIEGTCSVVGHFPSWSYPGLGVLLALAVAGGVMFLRLRGEENISVQTTAALTESVKKLSGDDKAVFDAVAADGTAFQSDLIRKLGYSKVKMSRILDKLEMRGLVERRRRGMANVVVLKTKA